MTNFLLHSERTRNLYTVSYAHVIIYLGSHMFCANGDSKITSKEILKFLFVRNIPNSERIVRRNIEYKVNNISKQCLKNFNKFVDIKNTFS